MGAADEIVTIVDEHNKVLGAVPRREMRAKNLPHRSTYILVFNAQGELYVQKRTMTKDVFPGYYDSAAGGVVLAGESYEQGAVRELAEEMGIDVRNFGSTTFRREDLARGFEPDSCFYIQHEADISGKPTIDLTIDPPPDLVIEVDITSGSLAKLPIYVQVGVPEIWRYDGQRLRIYILTTEGYIESDTSLALPLLTGQRLSEALVQSKTVKRTTLLRSFRTWVRQERRRRRR